MRLHWQGCTGILTVLGPAAGVRLHVTPPHPSPMRPLMSASWARQPGVLPLEDFNEVWRPAEAARLAPVYVERVSIREALSGPLLPSLAANVELVEPTFQV